MRNAYSHMLFAGCGGFGWFCLTMLPLPSGLMRFCVLELLTPVDSFCLPLALISSTDG